MADYTKVDEALARANTLRKEDYKDFSGVEAAIRAVIRNKNITEQDEVDDMARAIEEAIGKLQRKSSDTEKSSESTEPASQGNTENRPGNSKSTEAGTVSGSNPKTGDNNNPVLWIILVVLSGAGATSIMMLSRKKKCGK